MVALNKGVISDPTVPFGGVKLFGLEGVGRLNGIEEFSEINYIGFIQ
jgi:succinate-semialdehyde dehydrogenase/glutarate-semialdehyde dehydrogenase